jgi:tetratricopeptide (TPR) repeat protein
MKPDNVNWHMPLGDLCFKASRYDEAITAYQHVIELNPDFLHARISLAHAYKKSGKLEYYEREIDSLRPQIPEENEYKRACFTAVEGRFDEALELLSAALKKDLVSPDQARRNPDFESFHADPRFRELIDGSETLAPARGT